MKLHETGRVNGEACEEGVGWLKPLKIESPTVDLVSVTV